MLVRGEQPITDTCQVFQDNKAEQGLFNIDFKERFVTSYATVYIYPFFFSQEKHLQILSVLLDDHKWLPDLSCNEENHESWRHLRYFLPYTRKILFPEYAASANIEKYLAREKTYRGRDEKNQRNQEQPERIHARRLNNKLIQRVIGNWPVTRWRYLPENINFNLYSGSESSDLFPAFWHKISLLIFSTGVGFLLLEPKLRDESPDNANCELDKPTGYRFDQLWRFATTFNRISELTYGKKPAYLENVSGLENQNAKRIPLKQVLTGQFLRPIKDFLASGAYGLGEGFLFGYFFFCMDAATAEFEMFLNQEVVRSAPACDHLFRQEKMTASFSKSRAVVFAEVVNRPQPPGSCTLLEDILS